MSTPLQIEQIQLREAALVRQIEAVRAIQGTSDWSTLKNEIFASLLTSLERVLREEAKNENPNTNKLNRITGEIKWAERFSDLSKLEGTLMVELTQVRKRLHGKEI